MSVGVLLEVSVGVLLEVTDPARIVAERLPEFGVASLASPVNLGFNYWFLVGKKGTVYNPYVLFPDSLLRTSEFRVLRLACGLVWG